MIVKTAFRWFLLSMILIHCGPSQAVAQKEEAAKEAALEWLALVDSGDYVGSWEHAGKLLQAAVTQEQWANAGQSVRSQVATAIPGIDFTKRGLITARYSQNIPNAPPGEYVIAQYAVTQGEQKVIETVSLQLEGEAWKVVGYFIQPEQ